MRTILLAAGLGTRLKPITDSIPKCLVNIKGKPLLEIWLERLTDAGMGPFLINTHHHHEIVHQFIKNSKYNENITLKTETH